MRKRLFHGLLILVSTMMLMGLLAVGANAAGYPYGKMTFSSMPSNWQNVRVTVGDVTMPLSRFPVGHVSNDTEVQYLSTAELREYGITNTSSRIDVRGWTCVGFARHVYAALFYKYYQNASIDTGLGTSFGNSWAYYDVIYEVYGTRELSGGYSAATLKDLFSYCRPGAVFSAGSHTMVLMAIYDDGFLIYDCNYSGPYEVDIRKYTWQGFVDSRGNRGIQGLHMPKYYPGFSYSTGGGGTDVDPSAYPLNKDDAGEYVVYFCEALNVRTYPSTNADKLGRIPAGTTVTVAGSYNGWAQITYNGQTAWVSMDYLKPKAQEVAVRFDGNGATPSFTSRTYTAGDYFGTMPDVRKANRVLIGWTSNGYNTYTEASIVPAVGALSLKAKWGILSYLDVEETTWCAQYVERAANLGLVSRASNFGPSSNATRAQFVTVLGREYERESGKTITASGNGGFPDVAAGAYYSKYVVWGANNGIVLGYTDGRFGTNDNVTREQLATLLYRMAVKSGLTYESQQVNTSLLNQFHDGSTVSNYAKAGLCWAIQKGIVKGDTNGDLRPKASCTRAEMATMFCRYVDYYNSTSRVSANLLSAAPVAGSTLAAAPAASIVPAPANTTSEPVATPAQEAAPEPSLEPDTAEEPPAMLAAQPEAEPDTVTETEPGEGAVPETEAETVVTGPAVPETEAETLATEPETEAEAEMEPEITQETEEPAEPEPVPGGEEEPIPDAPEGMINVIFDLAGGVLKEPQKAEAEEAAEPTNDPDQEPAAELKQPEPQKYGKRYVICCRIGEQIALLPEPEQEGMEFLGWFCEEQAFDPDSKAGDQDLILTAKWKPVDPEE